MFAHYFFIVGNVKNYCNFTHTGIIIELHRHFAYSCADLFGHSLWIDRTCFDCHHSTYIQQQKNNGQTYKRKNFEHPWICRITPYDRCRRGFNVHAIQMEVEAVRPGYLVFVQKVGVC